MKTPDSTTAPLASSRRGFLRTSALTAGGGLMLGMGGRAEAAAQVSDTHAYLLYYARIIQASEGTPGVDSLRKFLEETYPQELSEEDDQLLTGALYLQATQMLQRMCEPFSPSELSESLAEPQPPEQLGNGHFRSLLEQAKALAKSDPDFKLALLESFKKAEELDVAAGQRLTANAEVPPSGQFRLVAWVASKVTKLTIRIMKKINK